MSVLRVVRVNESSKDLKLPAYKTSDAAGLDLVASNLQPITIPPGDRWLIPTGLAIEIPAGHEGQIRGRSGLAVNNGIVVFNGTLDADYRGEVGVLVFNAGKDGYTINRGDRIAQLVVSKYERVSVEEHETITVTDRNTGGYGSTGRN